MQRIFTFCGCTRLRSHLLTMRQRISECETNIDATGSLGYRIIETCLVSRLHETKRTGLERNGPKKVPERNSVGTEMDLCGYQNVFRVKVKEIHI